MAHDLANVDLGNISDSQLGGVQRLCAKDILTGGGALLDYLEAQTTQKSAQQAGRFRKILALAEDILNTPLDRELRTQIDRKSYRLPLDPAQDSQEARLRLLSELLTHRRRTLKGNGRQERGPGRK